MKLFIDSADVEKIKEAWTWGILEGVTTSASSVAQTGRNAEEVYREICGAINAPVCVEIVALTAKDIISQGRTLAKTHKNVVLKVAITKEGLKAVRRLEEEGIATNVTVTFSAVQALLAAKANASYISPFVGKLDEMGHAGMDLVRQIKAIYRNYSFKTQIITSVVQHPVHILESALAGADGCALSYA